MQPDGEGAALRGLPWTRGSPLRFARALGLRPAAITRSAPIASPTRTAADPKAPVAPCTRAAGTGRQTIYRRWPGKAELVLDAFVSHARVEVDEPAMGGSCEQAVTRLLERKFLALEETGPALRSLMAHAQRDPGFRQLFLDRFIEVRRNFNGDI